jgi:glycosyltransferase involved in cell wall biosynthesis
MFLGHRRDVNALMNACDAVVHASVESEPWGLVVAEGMAAGRVVIASAAGGPLEMIENRRNGLLVPPGDAFVLAAALEEVLARPAWRREMGEAARDHAIREYDPKRAAGVLCAELQDVFRLCGNANGR